MTIAAVICEYNPFHNGHKYQLDTIRKKLKVDYIICLMSGDFVQRGEPAIYSKELRTKWALENGADLVLQLPLPYATGSADLFAEGAVTILNKLGCVDYLCFGSECGDIDTLCICAEKLLTEGQVGSEGIRALMKQGNTFAKSRYLLFPEFDILLAHSNNVLALEYIMALMRTKSKIKPYTIKREGEAYEDDTLNDTELYLSATAVRRAILSREGVKINKFLPYDISEVKEKPTCANDFSNELFYALLTKKEQLNQYLETSEDLTQRMMNNIYDYEDFTSFVDLVKSKNYTFTRISRTFLHILMNIQGSNSLYKEALKHLTHVHILGFKESSQGLLTAISDSKEITCITKVPQVYDSFNSITKNMFDMELFAETLYNAKNGIRLQEYQKKLVLVK